jgi:ribosome-binding factor A
VLRSLVGRLIGVKNTPTLTFVHDQLPEGAKHLDELLAAARADDARIAAAREAAQPAGERDPYRVASDE